MLLCDAEYEAALTMYRSHYFKQDKPFMVTLVQLAVGMAYDADLNKDLSKLQRNRTKYLTEAIPVEKEATLEQRRTFVAIFYLSSAWVINLRCSSAGN